VNCFTLEREAHLTQDPHRRHRTASLALGIDIGDVDPATASRLRSWPAAISSFSKNSTNAPNGKRARRCCWRRRPRRRSCLPWTAAIARRASRDFGLHPLDDRAGLLCVFDVARGGLARISAMRRAISTATARQ
jgi:hypothetical protein